MGSKKRCVVKVLSVLFLLLAMLSFTSLAAYGHGDEEGSSADFNGIDFTSLSLNLVYAASIISALALFWYFTLKNPHQFHKRIVFDVVAVVVVIATLFMISSTLYLNFASPTKGPVHWHADYEIMLCDQHYELAEPKGMLNRVGTNTMHEHNDNRIHIEGVPRTLEEVALGEFFEKVDSHLAMEEFSMHSNKGEITVKNGQMCNGKAAALSVFVEKQFGRERKWSKLENAVEYVISPYGTVPPGDRLKIIFSEKTEQELLAELNGNDHAVADNTNNNVNVVVK
ncbi:hypothetical protein HYU06_05605 [Candidatus Woesearchaeota archaeon]|nr:hypothetical protein [Candidatus Woesearchaeota archaeon]